MLRRSFLSIVAGLGLTVAFGGCVRNPAAQESLPEPSGPAGADARYEDTLFDTSYVHRIDVHISDADWEDLLENAVDKTKYHVDVEIDGERLQDVAFSTKGNSSLVFVAADPDSSRYSFKLNFGKYVDGQTYHGLDRLNLNNNIRDATYMKDYFSYQLFRKADVPAPLASYAWLTVNGEDRGLYLAVEDLNNSFLSREYGGEGAIYKPTSSELALSLGMVDDINKNGVAMAENPHGSDFVYTDDDPASYPDIFENAETEATDEDARLVIASMKCLAEGEDPSPLMDTSEVIRFFATHNYLLNYDSYTAGMLHNLVLCESNGKLSLVPWDYNLGYAASTFVIGKDALDDATGIVNRGIDSPLIGVSEDSRPLWKWIVRDDGYREEYHDVLDSLMASYFESGEFEAELDELYGLLLPYVEKDPTAFYTTEEYQDAHETLRQFNERRSESVRKQLSGELATYSDGQSRQDMVDASDVSIMKMGVSAH